MVAPGQTYDPDTNADAGGAIKALAAFPGEHARVDQHRKWKEDTRRKLRLLKLLDVLEGRTDAKCQSLLDQRLPLDELPELPVEHKAHEQRKVVRIKAMAENARLEREARDVMLEKLTKGYTLLEAALVAKCDHLVKMVRDDTRRVRHGRRGVRRPL